MPSILKSIFPSQPHTGEAFLNEKAPAMWHYLWDWTHTTCAMGRKILVLVLLYTVFLKVYIILNSQSKVQERILHQFSKLKFYRLHIYLLNVNFPLALKKSEVCLLFNLFLKKYVTFIAAVCIPGLFE